MCRVEGCAINIKEILLLAIISVSPNYGYGLMNFINRIHLKCWVNIKNDKYIYKLLQKLYEKEYVIKTTKQVGNYPPREVFEITKKGMDEIIHAYEGNELIEQEIIYSDFYILLVVTEMIHQKNLLIKPLTKRINYLKKEKQQILNKFPKFDSQNKKFVSPRFILEHQIKRLDLEIEWLNKVLHEFIEDGGKGT